MMNVFYEGQVLWAQIDANQHVRHSAYADFSAQARLAMLESIGLKPAVLYGLKIGPVLFREELIYLREIGINEHIKITCEVSKARADGSRWSITHVLYKADDVKAAIIHADGAWIDMEKRRLAVLPPEIVDLFMHAPRSADYVEEPAKPKSTLHTQNLPMDKKELFEKAVANSKQLPSRPDNDVLLQLYSLYKQATEGDINTDNPPGMFDFVAKAKYDAWLKLKGTTAEDAMQQYISLVEQLSGKAV